MPPNSIDVSERLNRRREEERAVDREKNADFICNMICSDMSPREERRCRDRFNAAKLWSMEKPLSTIMTRFFTNGFLQAADLPIKSSFSGPTSVAVPTDKDGRPLQVRPLGERKAKSCKCTIAELNRGVYCGAKDHFKKADKLRSKQGLPVTIVLVESSDED